MVAPAQPNKTPKVVDFVALNFLLTAARFRILSMFHSSYALPIPSGIINKIAMIIAYGVTLQVQNNLFSLEDFYS